MSYYAFKNNLKTTLHYDMTDTDTVIRLKQLVTSTDPAVRLAAWPTCDAEHTFTLTLTDSVTDAIEIVECTEVTANEEGYITFSCQRAQEGTTATAHVIMNTSVEHRLTADALNTLSNISETVANNVATLTYFGTLPAGETVVNLSFSYDTTKKNITVFVAGVLQSPSTWAATSPTSITLSSSLPDDVDVYVTSANVPAESVLTAIYNDTVATVGALTMHIGSIISTLATDAYVPNGCVPCNGAEYTRAQFPTLYDSYLTGATPKLLTCTYTEWSTQVGLTGNCAKFALDTVNQKFKVPVLKNGDSITQAASAAELGKSYKAGLPNITFDAPSYTTGGVTGFFTDAVTPTGAAKKGIARTTYLGAYAGTSYDLAFDASLASPVYGNSTTVTDEQVCLRHFVVLASAQNNTSVFDWSNYMAALAGKANVDLSNATGNAIGLYLYARDEKTSGTHGGTSASAAWQTRDLNTVKNNSLSGASLANNRVTLPAGRYYVRGKTPACAVSNTRCAIYDATNSAYLLHGNSMYAGTGVCLCPEVEGEFTLTAQTSIELRVYTGSAISSYGLGYAASVANINEVYSELRIWKK